MKILKLVLLFSFLSFIFYFLFLLSPTGFSEEPIRLVVPLDQTYQLSALSPDQIASKLKEDGLIRSEKLFHMILTLKKPLGDIKPGGYLLSHSMSIFSIVDTLLKPPYQRWIVLVPGLRVEQIGERLGKKFNWNEADKNEFIRVAQEGYMFPDTYLLNTDYTPKEISDRMKSNFDEHLTPQLQKDLLSQNILYTTAIKIASLIERESGSLEDKKLIAGIIWNRLNKNMLLQIDATIQYAVGTPTNWWPPLSRQDMKIDSPFNSYLYKGLPPAPIASPSLASIEAAVYPDETDCLYYLHDHDKTIHCSVTYEEHLENIEKYLR